MFLYEVILDGGKTNRNWQAFYENVSQLNAKSPDYGGINNVVLLRHHMGEETIKVLCTDKFKGKDADVEVNEITSASLKSTRHKIYTDLVNDYFLPYGKFKNIKEA
jgi:hypothetical protein